ncbi:MAG: hypothetical protein MH252_19170 [Thermosynechococcaceae cyanobacterium MS004]|nr:hypothetical protein [Thermosynechococcaceae cyanobacterium MS004]
MLTSLLAEVLAVTVDNLQVTATILDCTQDAAEELSLEAQQRLNLAKVSLAMALQALNHEELQAIMEESDDHMPLWSSLI